MTEHIVGDWKSFAFRMIQPSDFPQVLLHLRDNFYRDEPLCRHAGYEDSLGDDLDVSVLKVLSNKENLGLSFIVMDKTTNKIAGVRISCISRKDDPSPVPSTYKNQKTGPLFGFFGRLSEHVKLFERYPNMNQYAEFILVSVDAEYRGVGLATEMYDRAFKMLSAMNFALIKCVFTSPYTQKIARKRGFQELSKMRFRDWEDENGLRHYSDAKEDEWAIVMVKELNCATKQG